MSVLDAVLILLAGLAAGGINAVVGAGTLFTFSTLVLLGFPPLTANVSNTIGLVPGSVAGSWGYRRELAGQRDRLRRLVPASTLGGLTGAWLLLVLPSSAFDTIVPLLIGVSLVLVLVQPRLAARLRSEAPMQRSVGPGLLAGVFGAGGYGGYFGAAQGVLLIGMLGTWLDHDLQRVNACKNVLATFVNGAAAVVFIVAPVAPVNWGIVGLLLVGSTVGGWTGAKVGRRLPASVLRAVIVVVGVVAVFFLLAN
ncbi:MAG: sulfite exporter TauE/SafE family protein [Actinomycetes bacterium]